MTEQHVECRLQAQPSAIVKHHEKIISIEDIFVRLNIVTMQRTFLLTIGNANFCDTSPTDEKVTREDLLKGFVKSNTTLDNLSLAIGNLNTCLIDVDNPLASASLASRLSKAVNKSRPVYVANNLELPRDLLDSSVWLSKLYMIVFAFVREHYSTNAVVGGDPSKPQDVATIASDR